MPHAERVAHHLRLKQERVVDIVSWPAGAGKTHAVLKSVIADVKAGAVVLWLTPTVDVLQDATQRRLLGSVDTDGFAEYLAAPQVELFNSELAANADTQVGTALSAALNQHLGGAVPVGKVFMATWQGYLYALDRLQPRVRNHSALRVVVDEIPDIFETFTHTAKHAVVDWGSYLDLTDRNDIKLPEDEELRGRWLRAHGKASGDSVLDSVSELAGWMFDGKRLVTATYLSDRKANFIAYLRPDVLAIGSRVEILGAHAEDSFMHRIYSQCGIVFQENLSYEALRRPVTNGPCFTIMPLQERVLSKRQYLSEPEMGRKLLARAASLVKDFYGRREPFIYCLPTIAQRVENTPEGATFTKVRLHGTNEFSAYLAAAFLAAINLDPTYAAALQAEWGLSSDDVEVALGAENAYQYAMRTKGRGGQVVPGEKYLIVVGGRKTAEVLANKIPGAVIDSSNVEVDPAAKAPGGKGSGLLGFLPSFIHQAAGPSQAQKANYIRRLSRYCASVERKTGTAFSPSMLRGVHDVAAAVGLCGDTLAGNLLKIATKESLGSEIYPMAMVHFPPGAATPQAEK